MPPAPWATEWTSVRPCSTRLMKRSTRPRPRAGTTSAWRRDGFVGRHFEFSERAVGIRQHRRARQHWLLLRTAGPVEPLADDLPRREDAESTLVVGGLPAHEDQRVRHRRVQCRQFETVASKLESGRVCPEPPEYRNRRRTE